MKKLIIVGTGIKSIAHLSEETKVIIRSSDKVLYLLNEPALKKWIEREAKKAESLEPIYFSLAKRIDAYQGITNHILDNYQQHNKLCVVFYGHPSVFASSGLKAVQEIKKQGGNAVILPAISAQDCLFSDLAIDPGNGGCFSIDATELLLYERSLDIYAHNIIWQPGCLGTSSTNKTTKLHVLIDYLLKFYPSDYPAYLYEAAQYPTAKPRIKKTIINNLPNCPISTLTTLYIPPKEKSELNQKYLDLLEINQEDFQLSANSNTPSK